MKALVKKQYILPFILIASLFFLWGAAHSILDVLNKHFQLSLQKNHAESSLVQVMFYLGYFVMAIPAGLVIDHKGYRTGVVTGLTLYGLGALMFWPGVQIGSFEFYLGSLFVIACGLVFLETAANPYVTELGDRETAASRLNLAQSFNGLGCICGPLLGGLLLFSGDGRSNDSGRIDLPYIVMGIVALAVAVVFTRIKLPEIPHTDANEMEQGGKRRDVVRRLFSNRLFLFGIFALLSYEVSEISINSFFVNYVTDNEWMDPRDASIALAFGGLGLFMLGRVVGSIVMQHVGTEKVLRVCAVGTFLTTFIVVLNAGFLSLAALVLIYVFESIMFPTIFALSLQGLGGLTKRASSFLMMTPVGGAIGPLLMGLVADASSISASFIVPLVGFANVAAFAFSSSRKERQCPRE